jgi:hypothetical protein
MPLLTYLHPAPEIPDGLISEIRKLRKETRFPTVCYMHTNKYAIYRSAEYE